MTTSLKRPSLSRPKQGERVPLYNLAYVRARNRNKANSFLLKMFRESGLTKKDIADLLGKKPEQITRWLAGPGNLTLDTISDLVFAMQGDFIEISAKDEISKAKSNHVGPAWNSSFSSVEKMESLSVATRHGGEFVSPTIKKSSGWIENSRGPEIQYATGS